MVRGMPVVLLKAAKEKGFVLTHRPAHGESKNIVGENRFKGAIQFVKIGNRVKPLGLIAPQQCPMQTVCARFCDDIEDASAGTPEFDAEIAGLHRNFLHRVRDVEWLGHPGERHIVVSRAIQKVVVSAHALTVDRVFRSLGSRLVAGPTKAA